MKPRRKPEVAGEMKEKENCKGTDVRGKMWGEQEGPERKLRTHLLE